MTNVLPFHDYTNFEPARLNPGGRENEISAHSHPDKKQAGKFGPLEMTLLHTQLKNQREQIARDLHDGIGSQLTHIISRLDIMAFNHKVSEEQLADLRDFTSETFQQLRETIWVLNQPEIAYGHLAERVRGLMTRISSEMEYPKLKMVAYGDSEVLLAPHMASSIFRIVQESVNNAMKYAHASTISVCLAIDHSTLIVQISDDGKGFCTDTISNGYGLMNIKKRAEELNGFLNLDSSADGTNVFVEFPIG